MSKNSNSISSVEMLVTPEKMYSTAELLDKNIVKAKKSIESMITIVNSTASYWEGVVAEKERARFMSENDNFDALILNLKNYAKELKSITQIYEVSEKAIVDDASYLPGNILN